MSVKIVVCPETITSAHPDYGLPPNVPCGLECEVTRPAEVMDCRCARGHRWFASLKDIREKDSVRRYVDA